MTRLKRGGTFFSCAVLVALAVALIFFASCGARASEKNCVSVVAEASIGAFAKEGGGIIVGFSQIGTKSAWRVHNSESMKEAAASMGIQLLYSNAEQKQANQTNAIRAFIVMGLTLSSLCR